MSDHLAALEARGDALEAFYDCERQAREWLADHGTQELVDDLRKARDERRRMRLGTINTLIILRHIDGLEELLSNEGLVLP